MKSSINKIISVLVMSAAFASAANAQIVTTKDITNNYDGTYTITMSAYATGEEKVVTVTDQKPVDAVLVLDVSGSMRDNINISGTAYLQSKYTLYGTSLSDGLKNTTSYYIYWSDANYYPVTISTAGGVTTSTFTAGGIKYGMQWDGSSFSVPDGCTDVPVGYRRVTLHTRASSSITRLDALKEAVAIFINNLKVNQMQWNEDHPSNQVSHRAAIVAFNSGVSTLVSLGDVVDNYDKLVMSAYSISEEEIYNTATRADYGMQYAWNEIQNFRTDATPLCLFFTDGTPTSTNKFEEKVASQAIYYARNIKAKGVPVYSLSVVAWTSRSYEDWFLNYISSNYPNATSMSNPGSKTSSSYYTVTTDQAKLSEAFQAISKNAIVGGSTVTYGADAYLEDVMSDYFIISDITDYGIYTEDFKEIDASGNYVFENRQDAAGIGQAISTTGIAVNGFYYSSNYCGYRVQKDSDGNPKYESDGVTPKTEPGGKRLVVVVNSVVPKPDADDTGLVPTNDDTKSGVFEKDGTVIAYFTSVPSEVYTSADLTINVSGLAPGESAIFTIESDAEITLYGATGKFKRTVALTAGADGTASAVVKAPVTYNNSGTEAFVKYTVTPTDWSWKYQMAPSSTEKTLYDADGKLDNVFQFTATAKTTSVLNDDEDAKKNEFQSHTVNIEGIGVW